MLPKIINAKQVHITEQIGQNITDDEEYLGAMRELVMPLNLPIEVKDNSSIDTILGLLKKPEDKEAVTLQLFYEKVIITSYAGGTDVSFRIEC